MQSIYLAGGCFWCTEAVFLSIIGINKVIPGYIGGNTLNPNYKEVCEGTTGHAEAIYCEYDEEIILLEKILDIFFLTHNPTQLNRQGNDIGTQYRSAIFVSNFEQKKIVLDAIKKAELDWNDKILTELSEKKNFYPAEKYHHNYYKNNPGSMYCNALIPPKLKKLKEKFPDLFKY